MAKDDLIEEIRRRWKEEGISYDKLGAEYDVSPRTIQRWIKGDAAPQRGRQPTTPPTSWPADSEWPSDWTLDRIEAMPGMADGPRWDRANWEGNLALIQTAMREGNRAIPWFYRRLVELAGERLIPEGREHLQWGIAVAALPPLGIWLGVQREAGQLAEIIKSTKPWESRQTRRVYVRTAAPLSDAIKTRIFVAQAQATIQGVGRGTVAPVSVLLAALHQRIPEFDRRPLLSLYRIWWTDTIIMGVLAGAGKEL